MTTRILLPAVRKYDKLHNLSLAQFKRLTGVKPATFAAMVDILTAADDAKKKRGGRASKLSIEDRLLMALEYLREYRTYFHIAQSYGVSESNAYKICRWVEDTLIKDKQFALPGRKELLKSDVEYEVVLIDVAESPVERPKKDKRDTTRAKRNAIPSKAKSSSTNGQRR
jgi:Helix-turn-helix of DDE superfamily endonuclease